MMGRTPLTRTAQVCFPALPVQPTVSCQDPSDGLWDMAAHWISLFASLSTLEQFLSSAFHDHLFNWPIEDRRLNLGCEDPDSDLNKSG